MNEVFNSKVRCELSEANVETKHLALLPLVIISVFFFEYSLVFSHDFYKHHKNNPSAFSTRPVCHKIRIKSLNPVNPNAFRYYFGVAKRNIKTIITICLLLSRFLSAYSCVCVCIPCRLRNCFSMYSRNSAGGFSFYIHLWTKNCGTKNRNKCIQVILSSQYISTWPSFIYRNFYFCRCAEDKIRQSMLFAFLCSSGHINVLKNGWRNFAH